MPKVKRREILLSIGESKDPPTEFRVFANGMNATTKGPVYCDQQALDTVMGRFAERGLDKLPLDYGHGMVYGTDSRAAGWFVPAARNGELWATQVQWTPTALKALQDREYRFFSPYLSVGYEDDRVSELYNIALVGMPATNQQKPLVMSAGTRAPKENAMDPDVVKLLGALGCNTVAEIGPKVTKLGEHAAALQVTNTALSAQVATLGAQVGELTKKADTDRREALCSKLPPVLREWGKTVELSALDAYVKAAPAVLSAPPVVAAPASIDPVQLDDSAKEILSQFGLVSRIDDFKDMQKHLSATNGVFVPSNMPAKKEAAK